MYTELLINMGNPRPYLRHFGRRITVRKIGGTKEDKVMNKKLLACTAAYMVGVLIAPNVIAAEIMLCTLCVVIAWIIISVKTRRKNFLILWAAAFLALGAVRCDVALQNTLYGVFPEKYVTVTGTVISTPSKSHGNYKYNCILKADSISYLGKSIEIDERIKLGTKQKQDYGKRVRASGFLYEFSEKNNENDFNSALYYGSMGIKTSLSAYEIAEISGSAKHTAVNIPGRVRSKFYVAISEKYSGDDAALLYAMILGDKSYFSSEYKAKLVATGVMHSVYSAYTHILLMAFLAGFFFRKNRRLRDLTLLGMLLFYAVYNSAAPNILKCVFLAALLIINRYTKDLLSRTDCLAGVVLLMTAIDPLLLFNGGFMLSAASTLIIYTIYLPMCDAIKAHTGKTRGFIYALALCLTLFVGTLPLCAYYFCGISPYTILFSPILRIVITLTVMISPVILFAPTVPVIGSAFSGALTFLKDAPYIIGDLPFNHIMLAKPTVLAIATYYIVLALLLRVLAGKRKTGLTRVFALAAAAFTVCFALDFGIDSLNIYFVNVEQGDGAVLHTGYGETILIDGGGAPVFQRDYNVGESIYLPYLVAHGLTHVDTAIVSHYHKDHVEGIITAAENLKVKTIVMPDAEPDNEYRKKLTQIAVKRGIGIVYVKEGDEIDYPSGLKLKILAPDDTQLSGKDQNDFSIVAELHYGKFTALFTGDSGDKVNDNYARNIDLLKVAHHGSETANDMDFVEHVNSKYAVISVGEGNEYDLPSRKVLERYRKVKSDVLRTDELGDIRFKIGRNGKIRYSSYRDR